MVKRLLLIALGAYLLGVVLVRFADSPASALWAAFSMALTGYVLVRAYPAMRQDFGRLRGRWTPRRARTGGAGTF
jgi:hypothetical protein